MIYDEINLSKLASVVIEVDTNIPDRFSAIEESIVFLKDSLTTTGDASINVKNPPPPLIAAKGDGLTNDTNAIIAIITYAKTNGISVILFPQGKYLVSPDKISIPSNMQWIGLGDARLITKETTIYNVLVSIAQSTNVKITNMGFDQTGDGDLTPQSQKLKGCHLIHIPDSNDVEIEYCKFWAYGTTSILSNPHDGYGNILSVHDCKAYWQRKTNTNYDVSVFNLDALFVECCNNKVLVSRKPGIVDWKPETAYEIHTPNGYVNNNEAWNCKNHTLHVGWPMLYTKFDPTYRGALQITNNRGIKVLRGISCWGAHQQPGTITRNLFIENNYVNLNLSSDYIPVTGIELADGNIDASYFQNICMYRNIIEYTIEQGVLPLDYGPAVRQLGAINLGTNNSCVNIDIIGNKIIDYPYPPIKCVAYRERGINTHKDIRIMDNTFSNCSYLHPYNEGSGPWMSIYNFQNVDGIDIFRNRIIKDKKQPLGIIQNGSNVLNIKND